MKLLDYMRQEGVDDAAMAAAIGDCSDHAVRKWKYGERRPDADRMLRIQEITSGKVTLRDWARAEPAQAVA
jgi:DNA-binding transcriptional regulator YdaS (Cro superfamily)